MVVCAYNGTHALVYESEGPLTIIMMEYASSYRFNQNASNSSSVSNEPLPLTKSAITFVEPICPVVPEPTDVDAIAHFGWIKNCRLFIGGSI